MNSTASTDPRLPLGFRYAATTAGLKRSGRADFACIVADTPASAAAMFTTNRVVAAPLVVDKVHLVRSGNRIRAVVVNAGNANCATSQAGIDAARRVCFAAARAFGCEEQEVFPSSTGIIGVPLPVEKLVAALPALKSGLGATGSHFEQVANAILTTDTRPKTAHARLELGGKTVRIAGLCKGSGMIHPQLAPHATMLVYLMTDAAIEPPLLQELLTGCAELSFNRISVDGDTSTNDTVLLLASGASGAAVEAAGLPAFREALLGVCTSLARQVVADGEGVTHVVELEIEGAVSDADALRAAKAIAHSPLVKTAWAGADPNWGRLLAALGYSGAAIDPARIQIWFGGLEICRDGGLSPDFNEAAAHEYIRQREFTIRIGFGMGAGHCRFWTTDLTTEYVHINADYSS